MLRHSAVALSVMALSLCRAAVFRGVDFPHGVKSFADRVVSFSRGDSTGVSGEYGNPNNALGPPDYSQSLPGEGHVSLGALGSSGRRDNT